MITIVVPLDGSALSEGVLPYVENLALRLHAEVYFVQVIDTTLVTSMPITVPVPIVDQAVRSAEEYLSSLADEWQAKDIDAKWEVLHGVPAVAIIDFARTHKAFMIAMSTHGRSGLGRVVFGSVADRVMREAGIPVLLVRPSEKAGQRSASIAVQR